MWYCLLLVACLHDRSISANGFRYWLSQLTRFWGLEGRSSLFTDMMTSLTAEPMSATCWCSHDIEPLIAYYNITSCHLPLSHPIRWKPFKIHCMTARPREATLEISNLRFDQSNVTRGIPPVVAKLLAKYSSATKRLWCQTPPGEMISKAMYKVKWEVYWH